MMTFLAQAAAEPEPHPLVTLCVYWGPFLLLVPLVFWLIWSISKKTAKANERVFDHYAQMRAQNTEMIALLRDIRDRLDKPKG